MTLTAALALSACALWYVGSWYSGIHRITIIHASPLANAAAPGEAAAAPANRDGQGATPTTLPDLGPSKTMNILLTGSDGRTCIDPKSPYAGAFLADGNDIGSRSDTIMVLRVDAATKHLGILSFPRDLWVPIAGTGHKSKINSAFKADDPNVLIQTIESTFGIRIDHYVGVDFCAFKSLVDAVGGVSVPFEYPTRDLHTGLSVTDTGCHSMEGDEALAYVRSRYYEYEVNGHWVSDGTSDYGRIARQQDFIRRVAARALDIGITSPLTAKHVLDVARSSDVRIDDGLSLTDMIRLATTVRDLGPDHAVSYRIEGKGQLIAGASAIVPDLTSESAKAILAYFRGAPAPSTPSSEATTTAAPRATKAGAAPATTVAPEGAATTASPDTSALAPNARGVYPPADVKCP